MRRNRLSSETVLDMLKTGQKIRVNDFFKPTADTDPVRETETKPQRKKKRRYTQGYLCTRLSIQGETIRRSISKYGKVNRKRSIIRKLSIDKDFGTLSAQKIQALEETNDLYFQNYFNIRFQNKLFPNSKLFLNN